MSTVVGVGAQWGDEGKGKIVDWLAPQADLVARFQGGNNAGHTLVVDGVTMFNVNDGTFEARLVKVRVRVRIRSGSSLRLVMVKGRAS